MYKNRQKIIVVGFVKNNHWVQVKLKPDCPFPPVIDRWRENCTKEARAWEVALVRRMRHWEDEVRKLS